MYLYERGILEKGKLSMRMILWYKMRVIEIQHDFFQVSWPLWTLIPVIRMFFAVHLLLFVCHQLS